MQRIKKSNKWQNAKLSETLNRRLNVRLPEALKKPGPEGTKKTPDFAKISSDPMSVGGFGKKPKIGDGAPYSGQADFEDNYIDPFFESSNPIQGGWDREYEELFGDTGGASKKKSKTDPEMKWANKKKAQNKEVAKSLKIGQGKKDDGCGGCNVSGQSGKTPIVAGSDKLLVSILASLFSGKTRGGTGGAPHMPTFKHKLRKWHDRQAIRNLVKYGSALMNTQDVLNWLEKERRYGRQPESSSPIKDFISDTPQSVIHEVVSLARREGWRPIVMRKGEGWCGTK